MSHRPSHLKRFHHVHLVGIKGVGMTTVACIAQDMGMQVTGSDIGESFITQPILNSRKIPIKSPFSPNNLSPEIDLVIVTAAHGGMTNPEAKAAIARGLTVWTLAEAIGQFMRGKTGISVCGVGGKTTTSAMASLMLEKAGAHPSYSVGVGSIPGLKAPGKYAGGRYFVAEADEYASCPVTDKRPKFFYQHPQVIILTNLRYDHPDIYRSFLDTQTAFKAFLNKVPTNGLVVASRDNIASYNLARSLAAPVATYGFHQASEWLIKNQQITNQTNRFELYYHGRKEASITLYVPGRMNAQNAAAVFVMGKFFGLATDKIVKGLAEFRGTKRRFEAIYSNPNWALYDDYAHHPDEIKITLAAARTWFGPTRRIVVIFEPHTFSRTKHLFDQFVSAFSQVELGYIIDIFSSARESNDPSISSRKLVKAIRQHNSNVYYQPNVEAVIPHLKKRLKPGDVVITMGAGSIFHSHRQLLKLGRQL